MTRDSGQPEGFGRSLRLNRRFPQRQLRSIMLNTERDQGASCREDFSWILNEGYSSSLSRRRSSSRTASITSVFSTFGFLNARFKVNGSALSFSA